jgi:AhpD family alkylhydroperoxidase
MGAAAVLGDVQWGECLVPVSPVTAAQEADVRRAIGAVPGWLTRLAPVPWIVHAALEGIRRPLAYAPIRLADLVGLVVSQDNSCRYCYGVQRSLLRIQGYAEERIDRLARETHVAELSPAERAALDFARRLSRANPRPGREDFERVVAAGLDRRAVVEVAAVAGWANFINRQSTLFAFPPESLEALPAKPFFRLIRPLIARKMRHKPAAPEPPPRPNTGPCARLVDALGDSPLAGVLRRVIDDAWASPILPRRTKALVLAVVARALGCVHGETEAREQLAQEGLATSDVDQILATLASPRLDAREARIVPFARETVRYRPGPIQERVREVCRGFTVEETLETVTIVALANGVCRLSVVLDAC